MITVTSRITILTLRIIIQSGVILPNTKFKWKSIFLIVSNSKTITKFATDLLTLINKRVPLNRHQFTKGYIL